MDGQEATDVVGQTAKNSNSSGKQEQQNPNQNPKQDELLSTLNNELNRRGGPKQGLTGGDDQKKVMTKENVVSSEVDLCPTSEARHLLLSLSIAEYEAQKERLLRLILKHNDEDRTCTHPDLVRVHPRPLEPGSEELPSLTSASTKTADHLHNHDKDLHHHSRSSSAIILNEEVQELLKKSFSTSLTFSQQQLVLSAMREDVRFPFTIGLTPERFPELVENNPVIATEILLLFMKASGSLLTSSVTTNTTSTSEEGDGGTSTTTTSKTTTSTSKVDVSKGKDSPEASDQPLPEVSCATITDYFAVLVNMEVSVHSLEVVNRLTTTVELPSEFLHNYVSNCIQTCFNYKEKYMQNRLVRLVCVFLQSIIRRKIIDLKDIFLEVESFCIDFSRIREAAALFRLMKQLSSGGEADFGPSPSSITANNNLTAQCDQQPERHSTQPPSSLSPSSSPSLLLSSSTSTSSSGVNFKGGVNHLLGNCENSFAALQQLNGAEDVHT